MANMSAKFMKGAFVGWTDTVGLHYSHDFDEQKIRALDDKKKFLQRKQKLYKTHKMMIRMIIPFSFSCETCGRMNNLGKKIQMRMEMICDDFTNGYQNYRFFGKCPHCLAHFVFRTDPEVAGGYRLELGGRRAYEEADDRTSLERALQYDEEEYKETMQYKQEQAREELALADNLENLIHFRKERKKDGTMLMNALDKLFSSNANSALGEGNNYRLEDGVGIAGGGSSTASSALMPGTTAGEDWQMNEADAVDFEMWLDTEYQLAQEAFEQTAREERGKQLDRELMTLEEREEEKIANEGGAAANVGPRPMNPPTIEVSAQNQKKMKIKASIAGTDLDMKEIQAQQDAEQRKRLGTSGPGNASINRFKSMFNAKVFREREERSPRREPPPGGAVSKAAKVGGLLGGTVASNKASTSSGGSAKLKPKGGFDYSSSSDD
ncbi:unnamed protein product [Amoebophrya sp. A120]|nr:unnamed protein product [Amoebophrya sp. A120]|eukprot:GSA120T00005616001.1